MKVLLILEENSWQIEIKLFSLCAISHEKLELASDILWATVDPNLRSASRLNYYTASKQRPQLPQSQPAFTCPKSTIGTSNSQVIGTGNPEHVIASRDCKWIKTLTRLRLGLSHFCEHKFKDSFQDTLNPFCLCGVDVETSTHFFVHCPLFTETVFQNCSVEEVLLEISQNPQENTYARATKDVPLLNAVNDIDSFDKYYWVEHDSYSSLWQSFFRYISKSPHT